MRVEHTVWIDRPAADVFSFLADFKNHVRFVPGLLEFELTAPLMEGAQAIGVRRAFGRIRRLPYRVTTFIPGRAIGVSTRLGPMEGTAEYSLEGSAGPRTRLTLASDYRALGPFGLLSPLLTRMARHDTEVVSTNLKRTIESASA
jgi:carbon monoxide dehydrogenase subunit G